MLIAILDFEVHPHDREAALAHLISEASEVRAMEGNVAFRPGADPESETRVTLLHEWRDRADFERYLDGEAFARFSAVLRPMTTARPTSRRFIAEPIEIMR